MGDVGNAEAGILGKLGRLFSGRPDSPRQTKPQLVTTGGTVYILGRQDQTQEERPGETKVDLLGNFPRLSRKQIELELELMSGNQYEELQLRIRNSGKNSVVITNQERLTRHEEPSFILEGKNDERQGDEGNKLSWQVFANHEAGEDYERSLKAGF